MNLAVARLGLVGLSMSVIFCLLPTYERYCCICMKAMTTTTATSSTDHDGRELMSRVSGRQRSQSEHAVSMKTSVQSNKPSFPRFQPIKAAAGRRGGHVWSPPQAKLQPSSAAGHRGIANGPIKGRTSGPTPSLAERHTRRCMENRRRKEVGYRLGVDY